MRKIIFTFYLITWLSRFKAAPICSSRTGTYLSCGLAAVACDSVYRITEANDMSLLIRAAAAAASSLEFRCGARSAVATNERDKIYSRHFHISPQRSSIR